MKKKITVAFGKGIKTMHIPFVASYSAYDEIRSKMADVIYPKGTKRIEASITVCIDLKSKGELSYDLGEIRVMR